MKNIKAMQRYISFGSQISALLRHGCSKQLQTRSPSAAPAAVAPRSFDVFISHSGMDTKRTLAGLLYQSLLPQHKLNPFLDTKCMEPGDKISETINSAIHSCKVGVGVAIFSPHYCHSFFCLFELAHLVEAKKKVIPIFYDIEPTQLRIKPKGTALDRCTPNQLGMFQRALEEARYTVGLTFDTHRGNWSELMTRASGIILKRLNEET